MSPTSIGNKKLNKGFYTIEILVVIAIVTIALITLLGVAVFSTKISARIKETTMANTLAEETIEAVRNFRDGNIWDIDGLGVLIIGHDYHPELNNTINPPEWILSEGTETINGFIRKVVFENVSRNPTTGDIEDTYDPSNDDPDTRKALITVSWEDRNIEIITYFTNWQ